MTASDDNFGFAPPPFNAADALVALKRQLRDLKLAERGDAFELRGKRVLELSLDGAAIAVKLARRPTVAPEWDHSTVKASAEQRKLVDEVRKRLARWEQED